MDLKEDILDGYIGSFNYKGSQFTYHVDGSGHPVLITRSLSARGGTYAWRYIFNCLAGTFKIYSLDVLGPEGYSGNKPRYGERYYVGLITSFIRDVIGGKTSIISGPEEAIYTLSASLEAPGHIDKTMLVYPEGVWKIMPHSTIGRTVTYLTLHIPKIEDILYGTTASKRSMLMFLSDIYRCRRYGAEVRRCRFKVDLDKFTYPSIRLLSRRRLIEPRRAQIHMEAPGQLSRSINPGMNKAGEFESFRIFRSASSIIFQRSQGMPIVRDALRFCDEAMKFLS